MTLSHFLQEPLTTLGRYGLTLGYQSPSEGVASQVPQSKSQAPQGWEVPTVLGTMAGVVAGSLGHRQQWKQQRVEALKKAFLQTPTGQKLLKQFPKFQFPQVRLTRWVQDYGYYKPYKNETTLRSTLPFQEQLRVLGHETGHASLWQWRERRGLSNVNSLAEERWADYFGQRVKTDYTQEPTHLALQRSKRWASATERAYRKDGLQASFPRQNHGKEQALIQGLFQGKERRWIQHGGV
ncbi:MAG: DUF6782 family putative metallopeptidase [Vampirovibrionales bacterium]